MEGGWLERRDAAQLLQRAHARGEIRVGEQFEDDGSGLVVRVAINELDLELEGVHRGGALPTDGDHERAYVMPLGVNRIIKMALSAHLRFLAPTWTIPRDEALSAEVLSYVLQLGTGAAQAKPHLKAWPYKPMSLPQAFSACTSS
jgi:hypothetical protein